MSDVRLSGTTRPQTMRSSAEAGVARDVLRASFLRRSIVPVQTVSMRYDSSLELHALDVSHNDGHLCPLRRLVEQRHLAQVVCGLGCSLACTLPVRLVLEAWVSLRAGWLLRLRLAHGTKEGLFLGRRG
jgi:hypothetical protein